MAEEKIFVVVIPLKPGDSVDLAAAEVMRRLRAEQCRGPHVYEDYIPEKSWYDHLCDNTGE